MYQSRFGLVFDDFDSRNQGCWSEVWFRTMSMMTLMPCALAVFRSWSKSPHGAVLWVDGLVVGDVVAEVHLGGWVHGG